MHEWMYIILYHMNTFMGICNIYSTVGRSIADIYDRGIIFIYWGAKRRGNMLAEVGYRDYGPTYRATYKILYSECATGEPFWVQGPKKLLYRRHFLLKSLSLIWDSAVMLNFSMVVQSPYYIYIRHTLYYTWWVCMDHACAAEDLLIKETWS